MMKEELVDLSLRKPPAVSQSQWSHLTLVSLYYNAVTDRFFSVGWLDGVVVWARTSDREIASSTHCRCIAG